MADYGTRVELRSASADDYAILHAAMERQGFRRTILGDNGETYRLPTTEYSISGNLTCMQVHARAVTAATQTGKKHAVLVTMAGERRWSGLPRV